MSTKTDTKPRSIQIHVSPDLHRRLRLRVAAVGISMREFVTEAVERELARTEGK